MNLFFAFLSFIIPFLVYLSTLAPTFTYGDDPELITAAFTLGIAHPPGYPLFTLLGKIFTLLIPFGSVAYRVNLMAACLSAVSILIVYLTLRELKIPKIIALAASLTLAFSRVFWLYSVHTEVFALNNLLLASTIYFTLKNNWAGTLLFLGLGLANQQNIILVLPALTYFFRDKIKNFKSSIKKLPQAFLIIFIGLAFYLYLPLSARCNPALNVCNPANLGAFLRVVTRSVYQHGRTIQLPLNLVKSFPLWPFYLFYYFFKLSDDFTLLVFALILLGVWALWKENQKLFLFVLIAWFFLGPVMLFLNFPALDAYHWSISERLVLGATLALSIWLAFGLLFLEKHFLKKERKWRFIFLILPVLALLANFQKCDFSKFYYGQDVGKNIFRSLPPQSIIFTKTDNPFFQLLYLQIVEKFRPDVLIIFKMPQAWQIELYKKNVPGLNYSKVLNNQHNFSLAKKWPSSEDFFVGIVLNNYQRYPVFTTDPPEIFARNIIPWGILVKIVDNAEFKKIKKNKLRHQKTVRTLWQSYCRRGIYDLKNVSVHVKNLIQVYYLAGNFKGGLP